MSSILVTGAAGFIGSHLAMALARAGHRVMGCDRLDGAERSALLGRLQASRVASLLGSADLHCEPLDLRDTSALHRLMVRGEFDTVVHLAAEAGVRRSMDAPLDFVQANLLGFAQVLEACRLHGVRTLLYASSSSIYGNGGTARFSETDAANQPQSFYAATKIANEAMARAYHAQYGLRCMGLRLFTVFGPWGRPDMAAWNFACAIRDGRPLKLHGGGLLKRDFTSVHDVTDAVVRLLPVVEQGCAHDVVNVGHSMPVTVRTFVRLMERAIGRSAVVELTPRPAGDVVHTCADDERLNSLIGGWRHTPLETAVNDFVGWFDDWQGRGVERLSLAAV
jgi:UDP-glucuronate 4-epimerase